MVCKNDEEYRDEKTVSIEKYIELQKRIVQLERENEILKRSVSIFIRSAN